MSENVLKIVKRNYHKIYDVPKKSVFYKENILLYGKYFEDIDIKFENLIFVSEKTINNSLVYGHYYVFEIQNNHQFVPTITRVIYDITDKRWLI